MAGARVVNALPNRAVGHRGMISLLFGLVSNMTWVISVLWLGAAWLIWMHSRIDTIGVTTFLPDRMLLRAFVVTMGSGLLLVLLAKTIDKYTRRT